MEVLNFLGCNKECETKEVHKPELLCPNVHACLGFVSKGILMEGFSVILFIILVNVSLLLFNEIVALYETGSWKA